MDNHSISGETTHTISTCASNVALANVVVAVRIRPLSSSEISSGMKTCCQMVGDSVVAIRKNGDAMQYLKSQQLSINEYGYDVVFDESSTQYEVFHNTAKPYLSRLLDGQNVTVFAYGATGAGKTHTMLGNTRQDEAAGRAEAGIIPNSVKELFQQIHDRLKTKSAAARAAGESYQVYLSFLEVYNEQVFDLLDTSGKVLSVREDQEKGIVVVAGITEQQVSAYDQVIDFILQGNKRRKTEATLANAVSSRSHAVLQLVVKHNFRQDTGREVTVESKLSLIDLAGSERASATNNRGARLQEGASINKSLLALANCINALAENSCAVQAVGKKLTNVKYRDSKLTHLLKSSLEGNCNLIMIANINPSDTTYEDSHNTLKYANRAKNIKVNPISNKEVIKEGQTWVEREMKLLNENTRLKKIIQGLEERVKELEIFKHSTLHNAEIRKLDYLDINLPEVVAYKHCRNTDRHTVSSNSFIASNEDDVNSSISSISTMDGMEGNQENHLSETDQNAILNDAAAKLHFQNAPPDPQNTKFLPKKETFEPTFTVANQCSTVIHDQKRRVSSCATSAPTPIMPPSVTTRSTRRQSIVAGAPTPRENNFMAPTASSQSKTEKLKNPFDLLINGKIEDSAARQPVTVVCKKPGTRMSLSSNISSASNDRVDNSCDTIRQENIFKKARKEVISSDSMNTIVTSPIVAEEDEEDQRIRMEEYETSMAWLVESDIEQQNLAENGSKKRKSVSCTTTRRKSMAKVAAMLDNLANEVTFDFDFATKFNTIDVSNIAHSTAPAVNTKLIDLRSLCDSVDGTETDRRITRSMQGTSTPRIVSTQSSVTRRKSGTTGNANKQMINRENAENYKMDKQVLHLVDL